MSALVQAFDWLRPWHVRELGRFADGTYRSPTFSRLSFAEWAKTNGGCDCNGCVRDRLRNGRDLAMFVCYCETPGQFWHVGHFAHVSADNPTQVAFTADDSKGERDIQTRMKPGKYLKKFFGDVLTAARIEELAVEYAAKFAPAQFQLATTPDDIVAVYANGPSSCMKGSESVRVYGAGDLAVAYLGTLECVNARCLVWPAKKLRSTIYGDYGRLQPALELLGYRQAISAREWNGAKLLREKVGSRFVCPFIDNAAGISDEQTHLVLGGRINCGSTAGTSGEVMECSVCEESIDDSHSRYHGGSYYCQECFDEAFDVCASCNSTGPTDELHYIESSDSSVCRECVESYYSTCQSCDELAHSDYMVEVDGTLECRDCSRSANECSECGERTHAEGSDTDGYMCSSCIDEHNRVAAYELQRVSNVWIGPKVYYVSGGSSGYIIGDLFALDCKWCKVVGQVTHVDSHGYVNEVEVPQIGRVAAPYGKLLAGSGVGDSSRRLRPGYRDMLATHGPLFFSTAYDAVTAAIEPYLVC